MKTFLKTIFTMIGVVIIFALLLYLPNLGSDVPGLRGFLLGLLGCALWWGIVYWVYSLKPPKQDVSANRE